MACLHPIRIKNRNRAFLLGIDKPYIEIPCGKCAACQAEKKNEWWIRSRQQIIDCINEGGRVFFPTFTYTERCLPKHYYRNDDGRVAYFPCFNHGDKDRYLNSFRKKFEREGIKGGFKYLWVSEYGENNTHRPHYHALFFFDATYNRYTDKELEDRIRNTWHFGRVDGNEQLGMKVNPIYKDKASSYVSKYCTKDPDFFNQPLLDAFIRCKGWGILKRKEIKDILPKKFASKGIGKGLVDIVKDSESKIDWFEKGVKLLMSDGSAKHFNLPRYVYDKLMYKKDRETGFKQYTDLGLEVKRELFVERTKEQARRMELNNTLINLRSKIYDHDVWTIDPDLSTIDQLHTKINSLMNGRSWLQLAIYRSVFKDNTVTDIDEADYLQEIWNKPDSLLRYAARCNNYRLIVSIDDRLGQDWTDEPSLAKDSELLFTASRTYQNTPLMSKYFKDFDLVLQIIDRIEQISSLRRLKAAHAAEQKKKDAKAKLKFATKQINKYSRTQILKKYA